MSRANYLPRRKPRGERRNAARIEANKLRVRLADVWPSPAAPAPLPKSGRRWSDHPGSNPLHRTEGRERGTVSMPVGRKMVVLGPRNPSRWVPHSSNRECERRLSRLTN